MVAPLLGGVAVLLALPAAVGGTEPTLTLAEAMRLAQAKSERAAIAQQELEAASWRLARARAAFFGEVTLSGLYSWRPWRDVSGSGRVRPQDGLNGRLIASLDVLDPRVIPLYRQASLEADAAALSEHESLRQLGFAAAEAFLLTLGAEGVEAAARRRVEVAGQHVDSTRDRQRAGLVSANDVTRAELELATAERDLVIARGDVVSARYDLAFLINTDVGQLAPPEDFLAAAAAGTAIPTTTGTRFDVEAALQHAAALEAGAYEPWLRYLPTLSVTTEWSLSNIPDIFDRTIDGFVGGRAAWSVWDGGAGVADAGAANADAEVAGLQAQAAARRVALETRTALALLDTGRAGVVQTEAALAVAQRNRDETEILYAQGLTTSLALADASQSLFEAEVARARARNGAGIALLDVWAALGLDSFGGASP